MNQLSVHDPEFAGMVDMVIIPMADIVAAFYVGMDRAYFQVSNRRELVVSIFNYYFNVGSCNTIGTLDMFAGGSMITDRAREINADVLRDLLIATSTRLRQLLVEIGLDSPYRFREFCGDDMVLERTEVTWDDHPDALRFHRKFYPITSEGRPWQ